ncbi:DUF1902 domain-containing protein [Paracoccus sediminis]|uniref:DUF1902 domain-containing protein n=1 Tax=Paracoccus sediminis TaxID=1214787 RepID=A0A238XXI8_9RHOB|nr:DUF1902 domain-containing protein [Paracoccus sediminis]TBN47558.1 DUF1902 domain-containing protein [Paracoccus sediminis]SNR63064.1 protein of unknown function [Paracoccus sediminis]
MTEQSPIKVRIGWDQDAGVWVATTDDVAGLAIEASSLDKLHEKVMAALYDLVELNGFAHEGDQIPVHLMTQELLKTAHA